MHAQMTNQLLIRDYNDPHATRAEERNESAVWHTSYITDIPISTPADEADRRIMDALVTYNLAETKQNRDKIYHYAAYTIERNGMLGFWCFTLETEHEIFVFSF